MASINAKSELLTVKVLRISDETVGIRSFELVSANGAPLPEFEAGAHIDIHIGEGLSRQYSLCNPPSERHRYVIGVMREPESRGGSRAMHDAVNEGDMLLIGPPRNNFRLQPSRDPVILFAGGIGVTPILSMAEKLAVHRAHFHLYYCGRSLSHMAFIDRISAGPFAGSASIHADDGPDDQKLDMAAALSGADRAAHIYVCGPAGFIAAVASHAQAQGFPQGQIHFEYFTADKQAKDGDAGFDVKLASSGEIIHVQAHESVVEALGRHGVIIETSCEQGICGTCLTGVLEGVPDHRDMYLSQQEQAAANVFLPCCSRSRSEMLMLDL